MEPSTRVLVHVSALEVGKSDTRSNLLLLAHTRHVLLRRKREERQYHCATTPPESDLYADVGLLPY